MSINQVKTFSTKSAKIVAGAIARYFTVYGIAFLGKYSIVPADWLTDPQHITNICIVTTIIVYEIEEMVWVKYGIDIPGFITNIMANFVTVKNNTNS